MFQITLFRTIEDFYRLDDLTSTGSKRVAIIGSGFLGSELACALANKSVKAALESKGANWLEIVQIYPE